VLKKIGRGKNEREVSGERKNNFGANFIFFVLFYAF